MLFSFICGLRRLFVMPFPGGNVDGRSEPAARADAPCAAKEAAPTVTSTAFRKFRRETEERVNFICRISNCSSKILLLRRPHHINFKANCNSRPAAAPVIRPKFGSFSEEFGALKFVLLKMLKNSARN